MSFDPKDWTGLDNTNIGEGRILSATTMRALYENLIAAFQGAAGAPAMSGSAVDFSPVSNEIGQAQLKTDDGSASESTSGGSSDAELRFVLPGGRYGFIPEGRTSTTSSSNSRSLIFDAGTGDFSNDVWVPPLLIVRSNDTTGGGDETASARQRYVTSSPPYYLDGQMCGLFVELHIDDDNTIRGVGTAIDPVWVNNGPTDVKPDGYGADGTPFKWKREHSLTMEDVRAGKADMADLISAREEAKYYKMDITQEMKHADMECVPYMMLPREGRRMVMLDPTTTHDLLELHRDGEDLHALIREGYIKLGNDIERTVPSCMTAVEWKWSNRK